MHKSITYYESAACTISIYTQFSYHFFADGAAVDPDSGLDAISHVYIDGGTKYFAILNLTDIQEDKNSYYKIQLIESDDKRR